MPYTWLASHHSSLLTVRGRFKPILKAIGKMLVGEGMNPTGSDQTGQWSLG